jgi:microcystin-dependent protein
MGSSLFLQGGTVISKTLSDTVPQPGHGFAIGEVIRWNAPENRFVKAQANNAQNAEVAGVVSAVNSTDDFTYVYSGYMELPSTVAGISFPALFLSDSVAGGLTGTPPSAIGSVVKPVVIRTSNGSGHLVVNYLGTQIGGSSTISVDQIQPVGTVMPYAGTVIPDTWLVCDGISYEVSSYAELYDRILYSTSPRVPMHGYVVTLGGANFVTTANPILVGDFVQCKTASGAWSGGLYDSNATIMGRVLSVTNAGIVVQVLPNYNPSTKTFSYPNAVFVVGTTDIATTSTASTQYRFLDSAGNFKNPGTSISITTSSITHFNVPDLRGRFAMGVNTSGLSERENDSGYFSGITGTYSLASFGGQESVPAPTISVATSGSLSNAVANFPNNLMANIPPYVAVRYIIKSKPYTRAAIIGGVETDYPNLLVGDLRSGIMRGAGVGEDLVFKTNTSTLTSGTERMRLTNGGNLGIGTANSSYIVSTGSNIPQYPLEVVGESETGGVLNCARFINTAASTSSVRILLGSNASPSGGGATQASITARTTNAGIGTLEFGTSGNTQRMVIDGVGNVGIGTSSPTTKLTVVGGISASGDITSSKFIGSGTIPLGGIIMWSGVSVPAGWALCDGRIVNGYSTPDLRGRFVVGVNTSSVAVPVGQSAPTVNTQQKTYTVGAAGGTANAVVVEHSHTVTDPGHSHTVNPGLHRRGKDGTQIGAAWGGGDRPYGPGANYTTPAQTTGISISSTGQSGTDQNLPPYYALAFIMRVS